jgi:hypothetical protein
MSDSICQHVSTFPVITSLLISAQFKNVVRVLQADVTQLLALGAIYIFAVFFLQVKCNIFDKNATKAVQISYLFTEQIHMRCTCLTIRSIMNKETIMPTYNKYITIKLNLQNKHFYTEQD